MTTRQGIGVTSGIAIGPVFLLGDVAAASRQAGTAKEEASAFQEALGRAASELEVLAAGLDEDAADILEFQIALVEDDDLIGPIKANIAEGTPADRAWRTAMDREIADYAGGGDEVFQARAGDLADLRERVLRCLTGNGASDLPDGPCILLARDVAPSRFLELDRRMVLGLALGAGSRTSHVSLLAQARGIPTVVGLGDLPAPTAGTTGILNADAGTLALAPSERELQAARDLAEAAMRDDRRAREMSMRAAQTAAGEAVTVMVNIDHPSILDELDPVICEGVGLTRTEFLFEEGAPDEEGQLAAYRKLIDWAAGRPVTIRTLDAGGDKPLAGITLDGETNPFLGVRGLRLSLMRPGLLKVQLRSILRAAAVGQLKVMLPMVTDPGEITAVRAMMNSAAAELAQENLDHAVPPLGIMVEIPATAMAAELFDADFYSIGTNDLIQYATACARDNLAVAPLARGDHPGVLRMIQAVVAAARARSVEVSVCGDMASRPQDTGLLLDAGVRVLSVVPAEVGQIKRTIADYGRAGAA